MMNSPEEEEQKLLEARQRVNQLVVMQLRPNQSPESLGLLSDLEQLSRAEVRLRRKALTFLSDQSQSQPPTQPDQTSPLEPASPPLSTKPEISDSTTSTPPNPSTRVSGKPRRPTTTS
jgi:hypothetical protein